MTKRTGNRAKNNKQPLLTKGDFCDGEIVEKLVKELEASKVIELCFKNFEWLINAMECFMDKGFGGVESYYGSGFGSGAGSYSNRLNAFEDLFNRADFLITVEALCKRIESDLLKSSDEKEYKEILFNIVTIKINDIERRLSDKAFTMPYDKLKNERIHFKKSYFENMLYTPPFFILAKALTLYKDENIVGIENRYGTLETLHTAILGLFNLGKDKITRLFSLKKLDIIPSSNDELKSADKEHKQHSITHWFLYWLTVAGVLIAIIALPIPTMLKWLLDSFLLVLGIVIFSYSVRKH